MFYLAAYALMNIGAFAVIIHISGKGERHLRIDDLAGLGRKQPVTAALLYHLPALSDRRASHRRLLRQVLHLPRRAEVEPGLAVCTRPAEQRGSPLNYYLRLLVVMYMHEPGEVAEALEPLSPGLGAALVLPAIGTFLLGVLPGAVLTFARNSAMLGK